MICRCLREELIREEDSNGSGQHDVQVHRQALHVSRVQYIRRCAERVPRKQSLEEWHGPLLERLWQDRVVRVGEGLRRDVPEKEIKSARRGRLTGEICH
jgi:hypothetical protein